VGETTGSSLELARITWTAQHLITIGKPLSDEPAVEVDPADVVAPKQLLPMLLTIAVHMIYGQVRSNTAARASTSIVSKNLLTQLISIPVMSLRQCNGVLLAPLARTLPVSLQIGLTPPPNSRASGLRISSTPVRGIRITARLAPGLPAVALTGIPVKLL
jgi:hypothetical protein